MIKAIGLPDHNSEQFRSEKSHTCDRCLAVWPKVPFYENGADIFRIEEKVEELLTSPCEVCQILGTAMQVHQMDTPSLTRPFLRWERWLGRSGVAVFHDSEGIRKGDYDQSGIVKVWHPESSIADSWKGLEALEGGYVDFDAIKSWLDECESHIQCKLGIQEGPRNLQVIDCMERAVILAPVDCQYVALSYVWGGLVFKTDSISRLLPTTLPRTIEDSIKATLLLGYRYLWVDAFCIQQGDAEDKHCQIQQMDAIYTSAQLTLIAAAGVDPSCGLPGVSEIRNMTYRDTAVGNICIAYVPPTVHHAVTSSRWFTRGWTFQEGYLSRRRLYFTESAVLFICNQSQEYEGFQRCISESQVHLLKGTLNPRALGVRSGGACELDEIMNTLGQYTTRELSYDYDALNAIMGVLNYHHTENQSINTIWGIPYQLPMAGQRIMCINWKHHKPATRRLGYPSWSPLGWVGSVEFSNILHQFDLSEKDAANISNHVRDGCRDWSRPETLQYLQITVSVHRFPVVRLVGSSRWDIPGSIFSESGTFLVLPVGAATGNDGGPRVYLHMQFDVAALVDYDSTRVICAVTYSDDLTHLAMVVLQDHGNHYERIGFAAADSSEFLMFKAAGFEELASTTKDIQTLSASDSTDFYCEELSGSMEEELAWLRDARKTTITLG